MSEKYSKPINGNKGGKREGAKRTAEIQKAVEQSGCTGRKTALTAVSAAKKNGQRPSQRKSLYCRTDSQKLSKVLVFLSSVKD